MLTSAQGVQKLFRCCPPRLRSALERWVRGKVVRRNLGRDFGGRGIYASPEASLIWALPWADADLDPSLAGFCREFVKPGSVVWDFGGHLGTFAFPAAFCAGRDGFVLSLEPDPFLASLMIKSEAERPSSCAPCTVLTAAAGRTPGFATLEIPERSRAANALAGMSRSTQRGGIRQSFDVPVVTVEQLAARYPRPDVVKMDIEGSELDALLGGERVFMENQPVMMLEVYDHIAEDVGRLLHRWGYRLFDANAVPSERKECERTAHNTLAIPVG
jgi:FkbM family methyltransferase